MFRFKKDKHKEKYTTSPRLATKILGKESGRRVFGFACSPDIQAQIKLLASQLNVPIFALVEHLLQLAAGITRKMADNPEENTLLRKHLIESHLEARTLEKIGAYDQDLVERLNEERQRRFEIDRVVYQIVVSFIKQGLDAKEIPYLIDYGMRCKLAMAHGQLIPKD
jgi:hypothetical protein